MLCMYSAPINVLFMACELFSASIYLLLPCTLLYSSTRDVKTELSLFFRVFVRVGPRIVILSGEVYESHQPYVLTFIRKPFRDIYIHSFKINHLDPLVTAGQKKKKRKKEKKNTIERKYFVIRVSSRDR